MITSQFIEKTVSIRHYDNILAANKPEYTPKLRTDVQSRRQTYMRKKNDHERAKK